MDSVIPSVHRIKTSPGSSLAWPRSKRAFSKSPITMPPSLSMTGALLGPMMIGGIWPQLKKRSEEHTSELQSRLHLVCRLLLEKKKNNEDQMKNCARAVIAESTSP